MAIRQVLTLDVAILGDGTSTTLTLDLSPFMRENMLFGSVDSLIELPTLNGTSAELADLAGNLLHITLATPLTDSATLGIKLGFDLV